MTTNVKFGTSGLRGLVDELSNDICKKYTIGFLNYLIANNVISNTSTLLVGLDLRSSSPRIAQAVIEAAKSIGISVINAGVLPTPALALAAQSHKLPAIMVTGSHIPEDRNGLKFYRPEGEITKLDELGIINHLPEIVEASTEIAVSKIELPPVDPTILSTYRDRCLNILPPNALEDLRIGVYQHSSVARDLIVDVLKQLGADVVTIERADHFVPVDTEALRDIDREIALNATIQHDLYALVSTDGDADRPLIAGSDGVFLKGDVVGLLTAKYLSADAVVTPVTSTSAVETSQLFEHVYRCSVGSPYVIEAMKQANADGYSSVVGFEANGGVLLGNDLVTDRGVLQKLPTRDAMLPILCLLGFAELNGNTVQGLSANLPQRFTASNRLQNINVTKAQHVLKQLEDGATRVHFFHPIGNITHWDVIDGLRVIFDDGDIIHFRLSGNAPELRCYSEAASQQQANKLLDWGLGSIQKSMEKN